MSIIGLIIIVLAYTLGAIISKVLFGSSDFLFNPQIYGPGTP
jgi:hypothetical protein